MKPVSVGVYGDVARLEERTARTRQRIRSQKTASVVDLILFDEPTYDEQTWAVPGHWGHIVKSLSDKTTMIAGSVVVREQVRAAESILDDLEAIHATKEQETKQQTVQKIGKENFFLFQVVPPVTFVVAMFSLIVSVYAFAYQEYGYVIPFGAIAAILLIVGWTLTAVYKNVVRRKRRVREYE